MDDYLGGAWIAIFRVARSGGAFRSFVATRGIVGGGIDERDIHFHPDLRMEQGHSCGLRLFRQRAGDCLVDAARDHPKRTDVGDQYFHVS